MKTSTLPYPSSSKLYNKTKSHTNATPHHNQNVNNNQKDYKVKYKGLKAEITVLTKKIDAMNKGKSEKGLIAESFDWDEESMSSDDEGVTTFKALMPIFDELSVGKDDARLGQWVKITMNKGYMRKRKEERKRAKTKPTPKSSTEKLLLTLMEEVKGFKEQIQTHSETSPPTSQSGSSKSAKGKDKIWFGPCKHCRLKNHLLEDCYEKPKCSTCRSSDHLTKEHPKQIVVKRTLARLHAQPSLSHLKDHL
nr:hypothetical protein [Tanacetum cinerariifolium]